VKIMIPRSRRFPSRCADEALRQVAFDERRKIHDLLMEGLDLALKTSRIPPAWRHEGKVGAQEMRDGRRSER